MGKATGSSNQFCMYRTSRSLFWFHSWVDIVTYFMRTIPGISHLLKPLDDAIDIFIKVLLQGYASNPSERVLFPLPAKYGGMGLIIPSETYQEEYENF